jgi:hypothetical protein
MKTLVPLAVTLVGVLGGCAHKHDYYPRPSETVKASASVADGVIKVEPEVLLVKPVSPDKTVTITWQLSGTDGLRFSSEGGIFIEGRLIDQVIRSYDTSVVLDTKQQQIVNCAPVEKSPFAYSCLVKPGPPGVYKYTIRLTDGKNELSRDPPIVQW